MRNIEKFLVLCLCVIGFTLAVAESPQITKKILVINTYDVARSQAMGLYAPLVRSLNASRYKCAITDVELDQQRGTTPRDWQRMIEEVLPEVKDGKYDLILAVNDLAYQVLCDNIKEIPQEIPIVFMRLQAFDGLPTGHHNTTGNTLPLFPNATAELATRLLPTRTNVVLLNNNTDTGRLVEEKLGVYVDTKPGLNLTVFHGEDFTTEEILQKLKGFEKTGFVIYFDWFNKTTGQIEIHDQLLTHLNVRSKIPVFVMQIFNEPQYGVIGGVIDNSDNLSALDTASRIIKIFDGKSAESLDVTPVKSETVVFWNMLREFGISESLVPPDAKLIGKPANFWARHQNEIIVGACVPFLFLIALLLALFQYANQRRKTARTAAIIDRLPIHFLVANLEGKVLYHTQGKEIYNDFKKPLHSLNDFYDPVLRAQLFKSITEVIQTGAPQVVDFVNCNKKLTAEFLKLSYTLFHTECAVWISHDTDDLQNAKLAAQESSKRFELTLNSIGDAVVVTDDQEIITLVNPIAEQMLGLAKPELIGKPLSAVMKIVNYLDGTDVPSPVKTALRRGEIVALANHTDLISNNGARYHIADSAAPIHGSEGKIIGAILVLRDVTEQYKQRDEMRYLVDFWNQVINMVPFFFFTKDSNHRYRVLNKATADFIGLPIEKIIGNTDEFIPTFQDQYDKILRQNTEAMKHPEGIQFIEHFVDENGTTRYLNIFKKPFVSQKGETLLLGAMMDITELEIQKQQLQKAMQDARAADRAKSYFLAVMSHEIRTPLNAIIGFTELLNIGDASPAESERYINSIGTSSQALLSLINDVLDLSKLEANQVKFTYKMCDLAKLVEDTCSIFTQKAKENNLTLQTNIPSDLPMMELDETRVRQILLNLVGNAMKFTHQGGVTVNVSFVHTGKERCDLKIEIADTGIGIKSANLERIFDPFTQEDEVRGTRKYGGTGLGLNISRKLAQNMNGQITATSQEGKGSTFTFTEKNIHCDIPLPPSNKEYPQLEQINDKSCILLVDDVSDNLTVLEKMLLKIGAKPVLVSSATEALKLLKEQTFNLILTDIWMPGMNGQEMATHVRNLPEGKRIKIIAITADADVIENFDMTHFDDIIIKPVTMQKLKNVCNLLG